MEYRRLGGSELRVSTVALGCWGFAGGSMWGPTDEQESIATIHAALDSGINLLDTAEAYGPFTNEELVGEAVAPFRKEVVIATKFGFQDGDSHKGLDSRPERIREAAKLGFRRALIPAANMPKKGDAGIELLPVRRLTEALEVLG